MVNKMDIRDSNDLLYNTITKIEDDKLFLKDHHNDEFYIDIGEGTGDCCNYGDGTVRAIGNVKLPALITSVEIRDRTLENRDDEHIYKIKLFGENKILSEIDYESHETGYYGSMTELEIHPVRKEENNEANNR
jgi:hypothetical protein